jgi:hypothetical protein
MPKRWIGLTLLAIGLTCLTTASIAMRHEWRFHREATAIDAIFVNSTEYEFTPPNHTPVRGSATTHATEGSSVLVFYLPTDPQQNRTTTWFRNIGWICGGFLLGTVSMFLGGIALLDRRRSARDKM